MSISDMIVVMKDGAVQQIGGPQEVYDDPVNLFVAKFLGTPPINVFDAQVKGGKLVIGDEAVMDVPGAADGKVYAAIRPEGFICDANGAFSLNLTAVEVMGRDISVVSTHPACQAPIVRAIVDSGNAIDVTSAKVRFSLKPNKVLLFSHETEERIRFGE